MIPFYIYLVKFLYFSFDIFVFFFKESTSIKTPLIKNTMSKTTRAKTGLPLIGVPLNRIIIVFLIHPLIKKTFLNASHTHFTDIPHTNIDANIIVKFRIEYKSQPRFFSLHTSLHIPSLQHHPCNLFTAIPKLFSLANTRTALFISLHSHTLHLPNPSHPSTP